MLPAPTFGTIMIRSSSQPKPVRPALWLASRAMARPEITPRLASGIPGDLLTTPANSNRNCSSNSNSNTACESLCDDVSLMLCFVSVDLNPTPHIGEEAKQKRAGTHEPSSKRAITSLHIGRDCGLTGISGLISITAAHTPPFATCSRSSIASSG